MKLHDCLLVLLGCAALAAAQTPAEPPDYVSQARERVRQMLLKMPDYTCVMTVERSVRKAGERRFHALDPVRLEIAYLENNELYAWPGSPHFQEKNLSEFLGAMGAIGNGDFAIQLQPTYFGAVPLLYGGEDMLHGQRLLKFTQQVPQSMSTYILQRPPVHAATGYVVTAWHDPRSLGLVRCELEAVKIPKELGLRRNFRAIEYQEVDVAGTKFRLPARTELWMSASEGTEARTVTTYSQCRQYLGESKLTFVEDESAMQPAAPSTPAIPAREPLKLRAGLKVETQFAEGLDFSKIKRGDLLAMQVARDVVDHGRTVVEAGAVVKARLTSVQCDVTPHLVCYAMLSPEAIESPTRQGVFSAQMISPRLDAQLSVALTRLHSVRVWPVLPEELRTAPEGAAVIVLASSQSLPHGYTVVWRTLEVREELAP
jgi:hypothetical protein